MRALWLVLALALLPLASPARAQTLAQALSTTYETNPTLLAARAELRAVNEGVPQAISGWRPNVVLQGSVGGEATNTHLDGDGDFGAGTGTGTGTTSSSSSSWTTQVPREVSLEIRQPIYRGGRTAAAVDSAEALVQAQRQLLKDTEQTVLLAAVQAYMDLWRDQAILQLRINNEERLRRQREAALDRFNVGEITRTDVAQAESRLAGATADVIAAQGQLETSRAIFRQVIGLEPVSIGQAPPVQGIPDDKGTTVTLALQDDPDVVASRFLENSALADVRERLGRLLPEVTLVGLLLYQEGTTTVGIENRSAQIRAEVNVPLYQQGTTNSQVRQAKQVASQRRLEITEATRDAEQEAVAAWEALITARAQIVSFQAQVQAAQVALEGVVQENTVGARTVLDILDAEQEVLDAQVSLVGAQHDEVVASFRVAAAIGRLTALDLSLPVTIYDPQVDYEKVRNAWFKLTAPGVDE
jgi:TolC family type I secretion outer membrane protein